MQGLSLKTDFSSAQTFGIPSIKEGEDIFFLKQLNHARGIRNNIIDSFEKAAVPTVTEAERRRLLSFVVVGGGPTSCEFVSELHGKSSCAAINAEIFIEQHILQCWGNDRFH